MSEIEIGTKSKGFYSITWITLKFGEATPVPRVLALKNRAKLRLLLPCSLGFGVRIGEPWNTNSAVQTRAWFFVVSRTVAASSLARSAAAAAGLAPAGSGSATTRMASAEPLHSGCTPPCVTPRCANCTQQVAVWELSIQHYFLNPEIHWRCELIPLYVFMS